MQEVQLAIWREVGRHLELGESLPTIRAILGATVPCALLQLIELDAPRSQLASIALDGDAPWPRETWNRQLTNAETNDWRRWLLEGKTYRRERGSRGVPGRGDRFGRRLAAIVGETDRDLWLGPLPTAGDSTGALLALAPPRETFPAHAEPLLASLLEPLGVACGNHRRLHELAALREAAEADRRSLLNRLGRDDMQETIVGADSGLRQVMERAERVASSDVPILILGDTGTGKEVLARAVHERSPRRRAPFIRVNCGAIPAELIDSQLFGHEAGSFTGAGELRRGWFERADGGTLFLDEIGELPAAAQVRLLRVLQEGELERVGGQQSLRVDVRIVAATHRNLAAMVEEGKFRADLWYRINVFPILLPPLRERAADIPSLVRHFAARASRRFGLSEVEATPAQLERLVRYPWPGNIRELSAVIDRAVILGGGRELDVDAALGPEIRDRAERPTDASNEPRSPALPGSTSEPGGLSDSLDEATRRHIERVLAATHGRIEGARGAANRLGINPHTLRARMRKLGIAWEKFRV